VEELSGRKLLDAGDYAAAVKLLGQYDTMEANVVLFGLRDHAKGPDAVEEHDVEEGDQTAH
jgi:hypothetical protein